MNKRIVLNHGEAQKLASRFGCSREMVSKSLNFKKDSVLARKIRFVAKEHYGGVEVDLYCQINQQK